MQTFRRDRGHGYTFTSDTVTRNSGAAPAPPWLIRYEVVSGPAAVFGAAGQSSVEVATDDQGRASVELLPQTRQSGATQIRITTGQPGNPS